MEQTRHYVRVTVLDVKRDQVAGEPFSTLKALIDEAWGQIPEDHREWATFEFQAYGLSAWYERPETEDDMRERIEFERLKSKFENERPYLSLGSENNR